MTRITFLFNNKQYPVRLGPCYTWGMFVQCATYPRTANTRMAQGSNIAEDNNVASWPREQQGPLSSPIPEVHTMAKAYPTVSTGEGDTSNYQKSRHSALQVGNKPNSSAM